MQDVYAHIAQKIIEEQEIVIGPVAVEQAKRVAGLTIDWSNNKKVSIHGNAPIAIDELVHQYEHLFGRLSVEVSKEAAASLVAQLPPDKQPKTLK